jgi:hypothetical protein
MFISQQEATLLDGTSFHWNCQYDHQKLPNELAAESLLPGGKGDSRGLIANDAATGMSMVAFVCPDRDRRYFITTCLSTAPGRVIKR